ncbi:MAG: hypothetical protein RI101_11545 [Nitrospira sp.]|jgi:hypothetical protein|nr:hypothetical protein [Nitrospira sp.]
MAEFLGQPHPGMAAPQGGRPAPAAPLGLELLIGSNIFRNTNGVIKIQGKEQLFLESKPEHGLLLVTLDLYSEAGVHVGHVRRNVLVLNRTEQFAIDIHRTDGSTPSDLPSVIVTDRLSGQTVLEARAVAEKKVQILTGKFYSHKGMLVDITPHYCRIGSGTTLFGDVSENKGSAIVLG